MLPSLKTSTLFQTCLSGKTWGTIGTNACDEIMAFLELGEPSELGHATNLEWGKPLTKYININKWQNLDV
jgi:hypothetical protein